MTTTTTRCPSFWLGSGIYSTTTTENVICEAPLTDEDGNQIEDTTCGFEGEVDVDYDDLGLSGSWTCPTCTTTNTHDAPEPDTEPDTDWTWD